ncbi:helix-turn-helix transcriptional regulator [Halolamina sp. CBA1230]|uniref:winged helix-turn-helix domain-containing protein n=1 Tax=Halolamina sp. CBA1230 TaxID=1853690 RepID=UPI0009A1E991|nr:helix-turn-helix domain-containing protein [Halolamina sp. CBA1230]QKY18879.1 helix-turn-helix transcriptional regulator [Halolamina sp. CBA1230]
MSYAITGSQSRRPNGDSAEVFSTEREITDLLGALDDPDCRAVLEVTGDQPLSAKEIVERCEIPSSTAYRKIDRLVEVGLLREGVRIRSSGKHASEYRRDVETVSLSIGDDGTEVRVVNCDES